MLSAFNPFKVVHAASHCSHRNYPDTPKTRNALEWPFDARSVWNMPIGCDARYVDAKLVPPDDVDIDHDIIVATSDSDPLVPVYLAGGIPGNSNRYIYGKNPDRCRGTVPLGRPMKIHFPHDFLTPVTPYGRNHSTAVIAPDGDTLRQLNALGRCKKGGPVYGLNQAFSQCTESLKGDGITCFGGHGGSGLSSIGGTLRATDFANDAPIRHALKINLRPYQMYMDRTKKKCEKRWPAKNCDNHWSKHVNHKGYASSHVRGLVEGALLALPPNLTYTDLGITTAAGKKFFDVLQDFGAYLADGSGTGERVRNSFSATYEADAAFRQRYGHSLEAYGNKNAPPNNTQGQWMRDIRTIISHLHVVDDNGPTSIGGHGAARRAPMAPPFDGKAGADRNHTSTSPRPPRLITID